MFSYYRAITVTTPTGASPTTSTNFPLGFYGTYAYLATVANGGHVQNSSGFDIGFYADNGAVTKLNWEIVSYNPTTGAIEFWVQIPSLPAETTTIIYLFYGDSTISTDQSNKTGTWDSNYTAVYHFQDDGSGNLVANDSTSNGNNGSINGATLTTGEIGSAASFDGTDDYISLGNGSGVNLTDPCTLEAWFNTPSYSINYQALLTNILNAALGPGFQLVAQPSNVSPDNQVYFQVFNGSAASGSCGTGINGLVTSAWTYIAAILTSGLSGVIQQNATQKSANTFSNGGATSSGNTYIGASDQTGVAAFFYTGLVDEVRFSKIDRGVYWLLCCYQNINNYSSFVTVGSEVDTGPTLITVSTGDSLDSLFLDSVILSVIFESFSDSINNWSDSIIIGGGTINYVFDDSLDSLLLDDVSTFLSNSPSSGDTINNWLDDFQLLLDDPYTFDDAYTLDDSFVVELIFTFNEFISDGINVQDSVITDLIVDIPILVGDSYSLSDAINLNEIITIRFGDIIPPYFDFFSRSFINSSGILLQDAFFVSDSYKNDLFMDFAYNDGYSINDSVAISDSRINDMLNDFYNINDGVTISLSSPLDINLSDNIDNFQDQFITANNTNINSYIRRYLNDVKSV